MNMRLEAIPVNVGNVVGEAARVKAEGYRFVTLSCVELDGGMVDVLYHFDRDLELRHLRLTVSRETRVPSLSQVYFAACLVENEIQDLFGLMFQGLAIDYERTFYLGRGVEAPFCRVAADVGGEE